MNNIVPAMPTQPKSPLRKMIFVNESVHQKVSEVAKANGRTLIGQLDYWASKELAAIKKYNDAN